MSNSPEQIAHYMSVVVDNEVEQEVINRIKERLFQRFNKATNEERGVIGDIYRIPGVTKSGGAIVRAGKSQSRVIAIGRGVIIVAAAVSLKIARIPAVAAEVP